MGRPHPRTLRIYRLFSHHPCRLSRSSPAIRQNATRPQGRQWKQSSEPRYVTGQEAWGEEGSCQCCLRFGCLCVRRERPHRRVDVFGERGQCEAEEVTARHPEAWPGTCGLSSTLSHPISFTSCSLSCLVAVLVFVTHDVLLCGKSRVKCSVVGVVLTGT